MTDARSYALDILEKNLCHLCREHEAVKGEHAHAILTASALSDIPLWNLVLQVRRHLALITVNFCAYKTERHARFIREHEDAVDELRANNPEPALCLLDKFIARLKYITSDELDFLPISPEINLKTVKTVRENLYLIANGFA